LKDRLSLLISSLALVAVGAWSAPAEVRLPKIFSDHAVLQRQAPIHVWGWSSPAAHLTARFHRQTVETRADGLGKWSLYLTPEEAGGPYTLTVSGDGPDRTVGDLLVGDVWFASGQSNMEMPLNGFPPTAVVKNASAEIAAATNPRLRLLLVEHKTSDFPLNDITASWTECTPQTAATFSAVAYFFGRGIAAKENVPIGLIDSTWGGTPADSWVSLDTLGTHPELLPAIASRARFADSQADLDLTIAAEKREDEAARAAGRPAPQHPWHPFESSWSPAALYNGMIAPFTPMTIRGFLWYQGETNSAHDRAPVYETLFANLIGDWRTHFQQGNLPFLYVQISSFYSPGEDWGMVREQQRRVLSVANTAMAVSLDIGTANNVHPPDKQVVGDRLALAARGVVYGESVSYAGPMYRRATSELLVDGTIAMRVWFDHAEGLNSHDQPTGDFELAGEDRHFLPAESRIDGNTVVVSSSSLPHPMFVRYGWNSVVTHSLYNSADLPASTFSSDPGPIH
jgi:sialate O-acetylesterase